MDTKPKVTNYIFGLGGRDIFPDEIETVYNDLISGKGQQLNYLGIRE